jgi:hypothetical protein
MFTLATFAEGSFAVVGWDTLVFLPWHLRGTPLNAAWIGHGGLLLVRRPWARWLTASVFDPAWAMSEQERVIMSPIDQGGIVRLTTPLCHIYGVVTLVGGVLWSGWQFFRKRILPHRVVSTVLLAACAPSVALASTLTCLGHGGYLYLGELLAAALMYAGFVLASGPAAQPGQEPLCRKPLTPLGSRSKPRQRESLSGSRQGESQAWSACQNAPILCGAGRSSGAVAARLESGGEDQPSRQAVSGCPLSGDRLTWRWNGPQAGADLLGRPLGL